LRREKLNRKKKSVVIFTKQYDITFIYYIANTKSKMDSTLERLKFFTIYKRNIHIAILWSNILYLNLHSTYYCTEKLVFYKFRTSFVGNLAKFNLAE